MGKKLTQEEYLVRCANTHGNTYGLQHIVYTRTTEKIDVECHEHGIFSVQAGSFMRGTGCAKCAWVQNGLNHRSTQEKFISDCLTLHGNSYDYTDVIYVRSDIKVNITCNSCGCVFQMMPEAHLMGQGCKDCGYKRNGKGSQIGFSEFSRDAHQKHKGVFSYEHVESMWCGIKNTKFELYCTVHEECFTTTAATHVKGAGCPKCAKIAGGLKNRSNTDKFVADATLKFGESFDYTGVEYVKSDLKVRIRCVEHDKWFNVTPNFHLHPDSNGGCPECTQSGYKAGKPGYLYVLHEGEMTKVGITNRNPNVRRKSVSRESTRDFKVLKAYYFEDGTIPRDIETQLLRELRVQYKQPLERFDGYKETFYDVNLASLLNRTEELISQQTKEQHSSNNQASQEA